MRPAPLQRPLTMLAMTFAVSLASVPNVRADTPPADIGAYLQAGAALKAALAGRHGVTHENLPGCIAGLELRPERRPPFNAGRNRGRVHDDGLAYAAGDSVIVTTVIVSRREIDVVLGYGGYDPAHLDGGGPASQGTQQQILEWQIRLAAAKGGIPTGDGRYVWYESLTPEARESRVRELESQRGAAIKASDDAAANRMQMERHRIARIAGSRIRVLFDHDVPLADLDEGKLRERLAPILSLAD
jgi:hypothetical protein